MGNGCGGWASRISDDEWRWEAHWVGRWDRSMKQRIENPGERSPRSPWKATGVRSPPLANGLRTPPKDPRETPEGQRAFVHHRWPTANLTLAWGNAPGYRSSKPGLAEGQTHPKGGHRDSKSARVRLAFSQRALRDGHSRGVAPGYGEVGPWPTASSGGGWGIAR